MKTNIVKVTMKNVDKIGRMIPKEIKTAFSGAAIVAGTLGAREMRKEYRKLPNEEKNVAIEAIIDLAALPADLVFGVKGCVDYAAKGIGKGLKKLTDSHSDKE